MSASVSDTHRQTYNTATADLWDLENMTCLIKFTSSWPFSKYGNGTQLECMLSGSVTVILIC